MTSREKSDAIISIADDMKAERIETLDVRGKTSVADYFIVCSGANDRHVQAIADRIAEMMAGRKAKALRVEGEQSGWVLHDYGDVVLHVMRDEQRQFYDLETLWNSFKVDPNLPS